MTDHEQAPSPCPAHEELLVAVMTGDLGLDDAAAAPLAQCVVCRRRLARLRQVTTLLDAAGDERRAILQDAGIGPRRSRRMRRWLYPGLTAALLALCLLLANPRGCGAGPTRPPDDTLLGQTPVGAPLPRGPVVDFDAFAWPEAELAPGECFEVRVFARDESRGPDQPPVLVSGRLQTNHWRLTPEQRATLAAWQRIEWTASLLEAHGNARLLAREEAWRR